MDVLSSGILFPRCRDKDGKMIFIVKVKLLTKGIKIEDLQRVMGIIIFYFRKVIVYSWYFTVYWFDRLERQEKGDMISILFESTGAGLSNLDMDFVQYFITLFRDYYPSFVNYIYVFELPWILNGTR